jgi:DNA-binding HxlR family transcriptional regulator
MGRERMAGAPSDDRGGEPWTRLRAAVPGRWDVPVLRHVSERVTRPSDLLRAINAESGEATPLSRGVLFAVLHRMIVNGLLTSSPVAGAVPPATHYSLTPAGEAILDQVVRLGSRGARWWTLTDDTAETIAPPGVDVTVPTPARVWNYWQGGKDNFQADRDQGDRAAVGMPMLPVTARMARIWQADVVRRLAERGVRQFLDIGTGLPSAGSVHEVAQAIAPESRVVYVDNDPIVLAHARALLASAPEGACAYLDADVRDPAQILAGAAETLDLVRPTAIVLCGVLHFVTDAEDPWTLVAELVAGISGDAYLAIGHGGSDMAADHTDAGARAYNQHSPVQITFRPRAQVARFYEGDGMELLDPGLIALDKWPTDGLAEEDAGHTGGYGYVALGYRPGKGDTGSQLRVRPTAKIRR